MSITNRYKTLVEKNKVSKSKKKSFLRWIERLIIYEFYTYKLDIPEIIKLKELINDLIKNGENKRNKYHNKYYDLHVYLVKNDKQKIIDKIIVNN